MLKILEHLLYRVSPLDCSFKFQQHILIGDKEIIKKNTLQFETEVSQIYFDFSRFY